MSKMFVINDVSGQNSELSSHAGQFLPYAHKRLGFNKPVGVNFISDPENAKDPLGKTAYYDPNKMEITIFVDKRHVKDILRSLSHELVHHSQNCRGDFGSGVSTEPGYAQKDPHMRKMEAEAYLLGNGFIFRDWEDQLKQKKENITMSEGYKKKKLKKYFREHVVPGEAERNAAHAHASRYNPAAAAYTEPLDSMVWTDDEHLEGGMTDPDDPMTMDPDWQDWPEAAEEREWWRSQGFDRDPRLEEGLNEWVPDPVDPVPDDSDPGYWAPVDPDEEDIDPGYWAPVDPDEDDSDPGYWAPEKLEEEEGLIIKPRTKAEKEKEKKVKRSVKKKVPFLQDLEQAAAELTEEKWRKGNKDQLMFETLMKKWTK